MAFVSYWIFPILSALAWLATLLALFLYWAVGTHETHFASQQPTQTIAYISDVGASKLKPLFIVGSVLTTVFLDAAFVSDRWLRHRGLLAPNVSKGERALSIISIVFAAIGTIGLTFLSGFDTLHYHTLHDIFLLLFIGGYLISAIFLCWEFQRLGKKYRQHRILRISFWIKLCFVLIELPLGIAFVGTNFLKRWNDAAILEWVVALIFTFYILSYVIDLWPAVATKKGGRYDLRPMNTRDMEEAVRAGHYPDTATIALPRTTDDSQRALNDGEGVTGSSPLGRGREKKVHANF
ncbi:hypothetical protein F5Y16DRAFT_390524 [Xylariaceae sp. FL0255]|nr:hypothetical protein F5Y16DRAFT_390524 [Xylariaceae sp. FL0255]